MLLVLVVMSRLNAFSRISASSIVRQYSGITLANSLSVSRSSRMLLVLVVMSSMYSFSIGWYTYRTDSVSTNVCCFDDDLDDPGDDEEPISLGKAASRPSIRAFVI